MTRPGARLRHDWAATPAAGSWYPIPDLNLNATNAQDTLFDNWRLYAFFTTADLDTADTVPRKNPSRSPQDHPAPPAGLVLGDRLDGTVRQGQRPAASPRGLTTQQPRLRDRGHPVQHPDIQVRRITVSRPPHPATATINSSQPGPSVDRG